MVEKKFRERSASNRIDRAMRPSSVPNGHFEKAAGAKKFSRFFTSPQGFLFGLEESELVPTGLPHQKNRVVFVDYLSPKKPPVTLGHGSIILDFEQKLVSIDSVSREMEFLTNERDSPIPLDGIQLFRSILETAIREARREKWKVIHLKCRKDLVKYYNKFGFRFTKKTLDNYYEMELRLP